MKTIVALGSLLVLLGALAYWTLSHDTSRGNAGRPGDPEAAAEVPASTPALTSPEVERAATLTEPASAGPSASASSPANSGRELEQGGGRILSGRVLLPAGAPADESLRILAFAEDLPSERVYGANGALAPEPWKPRDAGGEDDRDGEDETRRKPVPLAEAPVAADGAFRLALATEEAVHLAVDGRFLYSSPLTSVSAAARETLVEVVLGGCIRGLVLPPEGSGDARHVLANMDVRLGPDPAKISIGGGRTAFQSRLGRPDEQGRFELRGLSVDQVHGLQTRGEACAVLTVTGLELAPGEVRVLELAPKLGATVRGQVVDERGTPVPLARVRAAESAMWGIPGGTRAEVVSDESGRFVLEHVPEGKSLLVASKDGYIESNQLQVDLVDREDRSGLSLELGRGASLSGVVRFSEGTPAEGARVAVTFDPEAMMGLGAANASRGASGEDRSDAEGRFEVTGLGKGPFSVVATLQRKGADGKDESWLARLGKVAPETHGLELVLAAPCRLVGRVVDLEGRPVERFHVDASRPGAVFFDPGQNSGLDFVDPQGAFELPNLEPGRWQVAAQAAGFGPMAPLELDLPRTESEPVILILAPEASVSGVVLDPDGQALAGARVTTPGDMAQSIRRLRGQEKAPETVSDLQGRFRLTGLGPEVKAIHAVHDRFAPSPSLPLELVPGQQILDVTLRLTRGARVTGEVYDKDGALAGDTQVIAQNRGTMAMSMARTDGQGAFAFERLAAGPWTITAMLNGGTLSGAADSTDNAAELLGNLRFEMIDLVDGDEKHIVLGAPPESPVTLHGRVRHGNQPVTQGVVSFVPDGMKSLSGLKMASLDSEGTFTLQLDHPGAYILSVQVQGGNSPFQQDTVEFRRTVPEGDEHTLELELPLAGIRGSVRGPDGAPAPNLRVSLTVEGGVQTGSMLGGHYAESVTDESGRYTFRYLRPGTYTVAAGGALFGGAFGTAASGGRQLRTGITVGENQMVEDVDFKLAAPCSIKGHVRDSNRAPVKDAAIFVRNSDGRLVERFSMTTTGADGSFTYTGVEPGEYLVSARTKDLASQESTVVHVTSENPAEVELVMQAGSKLVVEVVDGEGNAVQAFVTVLDAQGREVQGMIGLAELSSAFAGGFDSTKQTIGPVPPGSYTVMAVGLDGARAQKPVNLDGQAERHMKLRLRE